MTIQTQTPRVVIIGNGTRGPYSLVDASAQAIRLVSTSHLKLTRYASSTADNDAGTLLVENTDYTVGGTQDARTFTLASGQAVLTSSQRILAERVQNYTQDLDLTNGGAFSASALATRFDKITEVQQELKAQLARAPKLQFADSTADVAFPSPPTSSAAFLIRNTDGSFDHSTNADLSAVADIAAEIELVAAIDAEVVIVADAMADVEIVADNIADVGTVADTINGAGLTTGTGAFVRATSPILVTPALGKPSSGNLQNCKFGVDLHKKNIGLANALSGGLGAHRANPQMRMLFVGTSITQGYVSSADGFTNAKLSCFVARTAALLNLSGAKSDIDNLMGSGGVNQDSVNAYEPRCSELGSTGMDIDGANSLGGPMFKNNSNTDALTFTPSHPWSYIVIPYRKSSGYGSLVVSTPLGTLATQSSDASDAFALLSIPAFMDADMQPITITPSGGTIEFAGVYAFNFDQPGISAINAGWQGATSVNWAVTTDPWSPANAIATIAPDLTIIELGANDWPTGSGITAAAFKANVQILIDKAKLSGDVILMASPPADTSIATVLRQQEFVTAMAELAEENSCGIVDLHERWTDYATANARGYYGDTVHPNGTGHADIARALAKVILQ